MSNYPNYSTLNITGYSKPSIALLSNQKFIPFNSTIYDKPFSCVYKYQEQLEQKQSTESTEEEESTEETKHENRKEYTKLKNLKNLNK